MRGFAKVIDRGRYRIFTGTHCSGHTAVPTTVLRAALGAETGTHVSALEAHETGEASRVRGRDPVDCSLATAADLLNDARVDERRPDCAQAPAADPQNGHRLGIFCVGPAIPTLPAPEKHHKAEFLVGELRGARQAHHLHQPDQVAPLARTLPSAHDPESA